MAHWTRRIPFQVDVAGVIQIMGKSLYARGDAPIRELIQNAHDAVMRRRQRDLDYKGRIDIRLDDIAGTLTVSDDGIGLSAEEAERYLGTLGIGVTGLLKGHHPAASEVDHGEAGEGLIGQFGATRPGAPLPPPGPSWESQNLASLDNAAWKKGLRLVWFGIGKDDFLLKTAQGTVDMLKKHRFDVVYKETAGGHTWLNWRDYLAEFAPQLFQ